MSSHKAINDKVNRRVDDQEQDMRMCEEIDGDWNVISAFEDIHKPRGHKF